MNEKWEMRTDIEATIEKARQKRLFKRVLAWLSAIVLITTMNQMKFVADTLERIPACGYDYDHEHGPECCDENGNLICERHVHSDACYQTRPMKELGGEEDFNADAEAAAAEAAPRELDEFMIGDNLPEGLAPDGTAAVPEETESGIVDACVEEEYQYVVGGESPVLLSKVLETVGLTADEIEQVGQVVDEVHSDGMIRLEETGDDLAIYAVESFDEVELAVIEPTDFFIIKLVDAVVAEPTAAPEPQASVEPTTAPAVEEGVEPTAAPAVEEAAEPALSSEEAIAARAHFAVIDLADAEAPFSLAEWMSRAKPVAETDAITAIEDGEADEDAAYTETKTPPEESTEAAVALSVENWTLKYDAALLAVEYSGEDYSVTPLAGFDETALFVETGADVYELKLLNWNREDAASTGGIKALSLGIAEISAADEAMELPGSATGSASILSGDEADAAWADVEAWLAARAIDQSMPSKRMMKAPAGIGTEPVNTFTRTEYRVFDISLENVNEAEYVDGFSVTVTLPETLVGRDFKLYHIHVDGEETDIRRIDNLSLDSAPAGADLEAVGGFTFVTDNFSKFILSYTVGFEFDGYRYNFSEGGAIKLSELFGVLEIQEAVEDVAEATSSDDTLIRAAKDSEGPDWTLECLKAFAGREEISVALLDGTTLTIVATNQADAYTATLSCDTDEIYAEVVITDCEPIPEPAELTVTPVVPAMADYAAYMSALNRGFDEDTYNGGNSLLYDISVMVGDDEYEPVDGKIEVTLLFKNGQLTEALGLDAESESVLRVFHLPVTEASREAGNTLSASDIEREYVMDISTEMEGSETVSFSLDSLSVITVTGASTDVTVNASLLGTDMKSLGYNLYAYLLASNDSNAYGAKIDFTDGEATATIPNVPPNTYKLYLVYARDNRELQTRWNYGNVLDSNTNNWVDTDGGYIFGYSAQMPADKTITASDNAIGFALEVANLQDSTSVGTIMDRALNYGIVAEEIKYNIRSYTNFAAKSIDISNSNDSTTYSHRADGIDVVPNILANINHNGQPMSTGDKDANYYVTEEDQSKVSSKNKEETILRNKNEIEDRVEIMISNTLRQADALAARSMLTLPSLTQVDVSPYAEDATIILDATAISGEQSGFTIVKRPGQTVVFNINGQNAAPPQNTKIILVDENGRQIGNTYVAGDQMRDAPASDGDVWNKVIWNFPDAASVTATNQVGGIFLVPHGDFNAANKGGGWIVARGKVSVTNEWYGFPGSDEPFKQKIIRKTFVGIGEDEIDPGYVVKLWTHTNDSASGTTNDQLITQLVLKEADDPSLVRDSSGRNDQTGYMTWAADADGNVVVEWRTPPLSVGNEHKLTEENAASTGGQDPDVIEFRGPYSGWSDARQDYVWEEREASFTSVSEFEGVFNVSSHNEDYRQYAYITNHYNVEKAPHDLALTKAVTDPEALEAEGQEYSFEVSFKDEDGEDFADQTISYTINDGESQATVSSDGMVTIRLKRDDTVKFVGLPYGTQYAIKELELPAKCAVEFSGDTAGNEEASGKLIKDRAVTATNTYSDDPGVPITAHKDLIDGVLTDGQFTFRLVDDGGRVVTQATNDANGNISFGTLIFERDGEYDYRLYELANSSMTDIIFDPTVYTVHITVEGGRAREVTYSNASGTSATTPMFRNRKIVTESDILTARKVFIDGDTGRAVQLSGGEFTFTATGGDDEDRIVYTGTNDADGMVTFMDGDGKAVDLNDLTQPTTFTIAETKESYNGEPLEGREITYDETTHEATARVEINTLTTYPVTITPNGSDNVSVNVTFTPSKSGERYYYTIPGGGEGNVTPRSDGTITVNIPFSKNQTGQDGQYREIVVEYGLGSYYYNPERLGTITIRAKGGAWGGDPIEVQSVVGSGLDLSGTSRIEKTVQLVYAEGAYPVFTNTITTPEPDTEDFSFAKIWRDATGAAKTSWPDGASITVNLLRGKGEADGSPEIYASYTIGQSDIEAVGTEIAATDTSLPKLVVTANEDSTYRFTLSGLPARETASDETVRYAYYVTEPNAAAGYQTPKYYDGETRRMGANRIGEGGTIANDTIGFTLPETGGPGTAPCTAAGIGIIGLALFLFIRKRMAD